MKETYGYPAGGESNYARYIRGLFSDYGFANQLADTVKLTPIQIPWTMTVDRIATLVRNSNGNIRCAIYRDNGNTPDDGALIVESASVVITLNKCEVLIADTKLTQGLYWLAYNNSTALSAMQHSGTEQGGGGTLFTRSYALAFGAFTDPCPVTAAYNLVSAMMVRVVP